MATSKLQKYISRQLSLHFGECTIRENIRPDWLNTNNGGNLELDFLIEELNVAIEVQGRQHYEFVSFFHIDNDGFKKRLEYDRIKSEKCREYGIKLLEISSRSDVDDMMGNIISIKNQIFNIEEASPEKQKELSDIHFKHKMIHDSYIDTDEQFALQIRRLLLSIATLIYKRYNNDMILLILKGESKDNKK